MALNTFNKICLFFLALIVQSGESRITNELLATTFGTKSHSTVEETGTKWAVLVAGSNGYGNYRHQADVCHAYQILKSGGLKDENIVVFMYDDIAYNEENPKQGIIINNPKGGDVYKGVPKDYTGENVTTSNLLAAILGNKKGIKGGSGKVVNSGPNDRIFLYYSDHGSPGVLTMPGDDDLYAKDFINTLKKKHESGSYKTMVIYVEACEAGSIFEGLLPKDQNIYVTTASNPSESSWATYCPGFDPNPPPAGYDTCLGDLYSVAWMEDSDSHNLESETLEQQYKVVMKRTADDGDDHGSHVIQYGNLILDQDILSNYLGANHGYVHKNHSHSHGNLTPSSSLAVEQHEADILYLRQKVLKAPEGSTRKVEAQKELDDALLERKQVDNRFDAIGKTLFGPDNGFEMLKTVRPAGQPIVDDWDCFKAMVNTYKANCGALSTYGKKHLRAFANVCNAGLKPAQMTEALSHVCGNN